MEYNLLVLLYTTFAVGVLTLISILKKANGWFFTMKFGSERYHLPPGDMGWPLIGNMLFFFQCFKDGNLGSFASYFVTRFGQEGLYKAFIFGKPSIIMTKSEISRKIFMDKDSFVRGLPKYISKLIGQIQVGGITKEEKKRLRQITTPIKSEVSLSSNYFECVNEIVKKSFEELAMLEEPIDMLSAMKKPISEVFIQILIGGGNVHHKSLHVLFKETSLLIRGCNALPINIPGFAYNRAIKAKRRMVKIFQEILDERKVMIGKNKGGEKSNIMLDMMLDDDEGKRFSDDKIISLLVSYTFAGFESSAMIASKAILYLEQHPHILNKAKEEQEDIVKRRSSLNEGLSFHDIKQMKYLNNVIDEVLRIGIKIIYFREAKSTVNINGYTIPEGWKFLTFSDNYHLDPHIYIRPKEFNPSRWDDLETKPASFLPFGIGPNMCPGANLARLEISVILHYFLLYYRIERLNPEDKIDSPETCVVKFKKL